MSKQEIFIETVAKVIRNESYKRVDWVLPSVMIAQACLESGYNLNAKTLFGIKGAGDTLTTHEYINGEYVEIKDSFLHFDSVLDSVNGYLDFIARNKRYKEVLRNEDPYDACEALQKAGYATDPNYASKLKSIIITYNLRRFDKEEKKFVTCKYGDINDYVRLIQVILIIQGYEITSDSIFGKRTLEAVTSWQVRNKLNPDGIVGEKTWKSLFDAIME